MHARDSNVLQAGFAQAHRKRSLTASGEGFPDSEQRGDPRLWSLGLAVCGVRVPCAFSETGKVWNR